MTLVTEKEAAEKWCPFAKTQVLQTDTDGTVHGAAVNRTFTPAPSGNMSELVAGTLCIGSRCMAWREAFVPVEKRVTQEMGVLNYGYCGAFGKIDP